MYFNGGTLHLELTHYLVLSNTFDDVYQFVLPSDVDRNVASGIFGTSTADYSTLDSSTSDLDTTITSRYLAVAIGHGKYIHNDRGLKCNLTH